MEHQQVIELINAVSASNLSSFEFEQDDVYINMTVQSDKIVQSDTEKTYVVRKDKNDVSEIKEKEDTYGGSIVKSPLVGTFYSASSPDADDFVNVGDRVAKGQTLGIIEAMKLMNEIESEYDGVVTQILVGNKEVVEYGQPLFVIKED